MVGRVFLAEKDVRLTGENDGIHFLNSNSIWNIWIYLCCYNLSDVREICILFWLSRHTGPDDHMFNGRLTMEITKYYPCEAQL